MPAEPCAEDSRAFLQSCLERGVKASPLCIAVIGWLCGVKTNPFIADIRRTSDGQVLLRLSGERSAEPVCSFLEFPDQIRIIGESLGLTQAQTMQLVSWARQWLG